MSHRTLREVAKFCAGLVAADLLTYIWFWANDMFPVQVWGVTWTSNIVLPGVILDLALLIMLIHYGWNLGRIPRPRERTYLLAAGAIFSVVAFAHLTRIFAGTEVTFGGWTVPLELSWIGTFVAAYLAYSSFFFAMRSK
jgi:hypothetical protein